MNVLKNLYASHCYAMFNRRIDAVIPWIRSAVRPFCGYTSQQVAVRFQQRCAELAMSAFMRACVARFEQTATLPAETEPMDCGGVRLETDRRVTLLPGFFLRALAEFILHWLYALVAILLSLRLTSGRTASATLVFGVGAESLFTDGSDARFLDYCRRGPVAPLAAAEIMVVQSTQPMRSTEPDRVRYRHFPLFAALRWRGLGPLACARALLRHAVALISFSWAVIRCPSVIILGRDAAYHAAAAALNRVGGLQTVVLTNSNYSAQALWMWALPGRRYRTHMVWYSQNSVPVVYADDPVDIPLPNFRFITVDETWVWTEGFRVFLEKLGCRGRYHVVGPILWYLPEASISLRTSTGDDEIRIAVFDVTPVRDEVGAHLGLICNYYRTANMVRFIEDIVYACAQTERATGKRVRILLKHKRSYVSTRDPRYIALIEKLSGPGQAIELVSPETNIYSFASSCDLTLVIPYSSPVHVAVSCGRPAIFYDPTMEVQPVYEVHPLLKFIVGRENLEKALLKILNTGQHEARLHQQ